MTPTTRRGHFLLCGKVWFMDPHDTEEFLNELLEKWQDAYATSDDWVEKNLSVEFLEDLHDLEKILHG